MKIAIDVFDPSSIDRAIKQLEDYSKGLERKCEVLCERLTMMGATNVSMMFSQLIYTGPVDISISVENLGDNQYAIVASGETVLIAEFGAGLIGGGHPLNDQLGMGPGTYPEQKHALDPNGWWLPRDKTDGHSMHTYGNPPTMAMYNTAKDLKGEIQRIAREVFSSGM